MTPNKRMAKSHSIERIEVFLSYLLYAIKEERQHIEVFLVMKMTYETEISVGGKSELGVFQSFTL